jgi:GNAT superfamily N-acetyltransferase
VSLRDAAADASTNGLGFRSIVVSASLTPFQRCPDQLEDAVGGGYQCTFPSPHLPAPEPSIGIYASMNCSVYPGVPGEARKLIWEVFFASRQRGINLKAHFPWIDQENNIHCFALTKPGNSDFLATLILKTQFINSRMNYAMVGMVCVKEEWRRSGLGKQLMTYMLDYSEKNQISALVLWTTQPNFYSRYGFIIDNSDCSGNVALKPQRENVKVEYKTKSAHPSISLPPFAKRIIHYEGKESELFVIESKNGLLLAEWIGTPSSVVDLVESVMPLKWDLSTSEGNPIINELKSRGHTYIPCKNGDRMIRYLNAPMQIPYVSVLHRI